MRFKGIDLFCKGAMVFVLTLALSACVVFGDGVVKSVETHYVTSPREVLTDSGGSASHRVEGSFSIDDPPEIGKVYENEDGATLEFRNDGTKTYAILRSSGGEEARYEFFDHGGPKKAKVIGVYWSAQ